RERVTADSRRICDLASAAGIEVAYEYHGGTLTDTLEGTLSLLKTVDRPNLRTLWQPRGDADPDTWIGELEALRPWLANVHVFHWIGRERAPLAEAKARWRGVLDLLAADPRRFGLLLEFVRDDSPEQFLEDAAALRAWIPERGGR